MRVVLRTDAPSADTDEARHEVLKRLAQAEYSFMAPAPSTVARLRLKRGLRSAGTLEDVFGWNMPFELAGLFGDWGLLLARAQMARPSGHRWVATLRVAKVREHLFLHSAYPARARNSVFLGPDSARFADWIVECLRNRPAPKHIVDIGAGSGVGGVVAASRSPGAELVLLDINPEALRLAQINARFAGLGASVIESRGLGSWGDHADLILANPPYLGGGPSHTYSDGGGALGGGLTIDWTRQALEALPSGGSFVLYSGAPITRDGDTLRPALERLARSAGASFLYRELEPDIFPSTLLHRPYWAVERIAAVGALMTRP